MHRRSPLLSIVAAALLCVAAVTSAQAETRRYLYVVTPGIRNYLEFGGAGILVFDIDNGHKLVKRIATPASTADKPDNIKGVCAHAPSNRLYFTTRSKLYAVDLLTEKTLWEMELPLGTDRMSITPDGHLIYVPSFEKETWNVVDPRNPRNGELITSIETRSGAHNTVCGLDGKRMYLAGLKSSDLSIADTATHQVVGKVGPFSGPVRPFTVNGAQTRVYACVNGLLGFEVGDITTGKVIDRVEVQGVARGPVKRHGCPSHGIGLRPDEKEVWVSDGHNSMLHVFDLNPAPAPGSAAGSAGKPKQIASIALREQPGWVTFSLDGKLAWSSTGEVIDTATKKIIAKLTDEHGGEVHSEKVIEIQFDGDRPVRNGDQFGLGRVAPMR